VRGLQGIPGPAGRDGKDGAPGRDAPRLAELVGLKSRVSELAKIHRTNTALIEELKLIVNVLAAKVQAIESERRKW
jgi:hypothetical protein